MARIILVHGAWHGPWCWAQVADALSDRGHDVDAVTLPGHEVPGTSERLWHRIPQYVETVTVAVRAASAPPVLVGHSMGGYVVQRFLEAADAACGVLVASVPQQGTLRPNLRALRRQTVPTLKSMLLCDYSHLVATDDLVRDLFFVDNTPVEIVASCRSRLQNESALAINTMAIRRTRPDRVSTPVQVIGAAGDGVFTVDEQHGLAAAYGVEAEILEGGHDLMLDATWPTLVDSLDRIAHQF